MRRNEDGKEGGNVGRANLGTTQIPFLLLWGKIGLQDFWLAVWPTLAPLNLVVQSKPTLWQVDFRNVLPHSEQREDSVKARGSKRSHDGFTEAATFKPSHLLGIIIYFIHSWFLGMWLGREDGQKEDMVTTTSSSLSCPDLLRQTGLPTTYDLFSIIERQPGLPTSCLQEPRKPCKWVRLELAPNYWERIISALSRDI